jgi:hypothetical protein
MARRKSGRTPAPGETPAAELRWEWLLMQHRTQRQAWVMSALERNGWSLQLTARELDIGPSSLQRLIETHGLLLEYRGHAPKPGRRKRRA